MRQGELSPPVGARRNRKRLGRGFGSGRGRTAGKGTKGQKARSGYKVRAGFEGGQLSLVKRLPKKRGFTNIFRTEYEIVKVGLTASSLRLRLHPRGWWSRGWFVR